MSYEPFHSSDGSPIGLRLRYRIRFAADALIACRFRPSRRAIPIAIGLA